MPRLQGGQLHLGFVLALLAAVVVWWILDRSTTGFAIRAVGANPNAAATAGMSVGRTTMITMCLGRRTGGTGRSPGRLGSECLRTAGAALGRDRRLDRLRRDHRCAARPVTGRSGIVLAGLLFGALHAGGLAMQSVAQTPLTLTTVLQALIVLFVAAPALVTKIVPFLKPRKTRALGPVPEGGLA